MIDSVDANSPLHPTISSPLHLRPAVFLDRDGVLNQDSPQFIKTPDEFQLLPGVAEAVARLNRAGYLAVVITNQSGIPRGLVTEENLTGIHEKLRSEMASAGGRITGIYYCPHLPDDGCECRKPKPGMVLTAARDHGIDLKDSWLIGDKPEDIECGSTAECKTILVLSGQTRNYAPERFRIQPDHVAMDLNSAADLILSSDS